MMSIRTHEVMSMKKTKLKMGVVFSTEKPQKDIENKDEPKPLYPSAPVLLEVAKDEYTKERERSNSLDNKSSVFISAIIAMVTIFIPIIPFKEVMTVYASGNNVSISILTIISCIFITAVAYLIAAFYKLYTAFKLKAYSRVCFDDLQDKDILAAEPSAAQKGLIDHYCTILNTNENINNEKADKVSLGLKYSIIGFSLLVLSAISLIIITNIGG